MQSAVATEFVPQPSDRLRPSSATYIYDSVTICDCWMTQQTRIRSIPTPPHVPRIEIDTVVLDDLYNPRVRPNFDQSDFIPRLEPIETMPFKKSARADDWFWHTARIPPIFPTRFLQGDHSGYCKMRFDIDTDGRTKNIETTKCTDEILQKSSIESVKRWRYTPNAPARVGVETIIRYNLQDENGKLLPLPEGY